MNLTKKIMLAGLCVAMVGVLSACGTVSGFGRDVSTVGHGIQKVGTR